MDREPLVFISFATHDHDTAWEICQALEGRELRCWISLRDLETGSRYGDEIIQQIKNSEALVLVLSSAANDSEFVHREVERAVNYRIPIFSVRIEEVLPGSALELFISATQWIDLWSDDSSAQMDRLSHDIHSRRRRISPGAPAAPPARSVEASARSRPREPSHPTGSDHGWVRRYGGLLLAAAAVGVFGVLNLSRIGGSAELDFEMPKNVSDTSGTARVPPRVVGPGGTDTSRTSGPDPVPVKIGASEVLESDAAAKELPDRPQAEGILVAVYGEAGAETVETVLLGELAERGHSTMDRVTLDPASASRAVPVDAEQLRALRDDSGVALVIVADLRTEATPSVGDMYTGRATLSVRTYDTETGRLIGTHTFQVGAGDTPGKIGASAMAATNVAVSQVAYQAAIALAREIRLVVNRR